MSPEAHAGYAAPTARVPRTIFQHAHVDGVATFPAVIDGGDGEIFILMPDNFNGLDALVLWFYTVDANNVVVNITVNIGTCNEQKDAHTQTVNAIGFAVGADEYECVDLTVTFATVLANLASRDMMWIVVDWVSADEVIYLVGGEVQET